MKHKHLSKAEVLTSDRLGQTPQIGPPQGGSDPHDEALGLRQIYPSASSGVELAEETAVDIVAIHGKGAHPVDTWGTLRSPGLDVKEQANWINWLEDKQMLPAEFPAARILRYGYHSDWFGEHAVKTRAATIAEGLLDELNDMRKEHTDRPIIFIAHSFGGLVLVKTLLLSQHENGRWKSIYDSTLGVVFLGTPFHGVHDMLHVDILHEAESSLGESGVMHENHRASKAENDWLTELFIEFTQMLRRGSAFKIACFYEQKATDAGLLLRNVGDFFYEKGKYKVILVSQSSASLESRKQLIGNYPRACNHFELNKYPSLESPEWKTLIRVLSEMKQAKTLLEEADAYIAHHCYDPKRLKIERLSGELLDMEQCYINLTIVKKLQKTEIVTKCQEDGYQSSSFSHVARLKVERPDKDQEIPLQALFDPRKIHGEEVRQPSRILIRGRAGMGKTTLCKKIVHQFTHEKMWQRKFCRVLWVPLRSLKLKERRQVAGYNLRHLLSHEVFAESPKMDLLANVLWQDLVTVHNGNTLFILDGLDEVSNDLEGDMQRFLESLLNYPNVIITSRPHSTLPPRVDSVDLEVETIGFHPQQVKEYILTAFSDMPNIGANVGSFLQDHQLMQDLVRIPVQLDALCYIWMDLGDQPIPQTMTAIYHTIEKNLWRKDGVKLGKFRSTQTVSRRALEAYMLDERHFLETLAFTGMYTNIVDFTQDHQDKILDEVLETRTSFLDNELSQLSFLRTSNPSSRGEDRWYHFLHLTYQEYFAAQYFVRQWLHEERLSCYDWNDSKEAVSIYDFIQKYKYDTRYNIMWRFVVGLLNIRNGQEKRFFEMIEREPRDLLGPVHQRLVMQCLSEVVSSADPSFVETRKRLEDDLARWIVVECQQTGKSLLAGESELSDKALENVFHQSSDDVKTTVFKATTRRRTLPSCMIKFASLWLSGSTHIIQRNVAISFLKKQPCLSKDVFQSIVIMLEGQGQDMRRAAIEILGEQPHLPENVLQSVAVLLEHKDWYVRQAAIKVIKMQTNLSKEMLVSTVARLEHQDRNVREASIEILGKQSHLSEESDVLQSVAARLGHQDWYVRHAAVEIIGNLSPLPGQLIQSIAVLLEDQDGDVQRAAIEVLRDQPHLSEDVLQLVAVQLEDRYQDVRRAAIEALRKQPCLSKVIIRLVAARLRDQDRDVRRAAIDILGKQSSLPEVLIQLVTARLQDQDQEVRLAATKVLMEKSRFSGNIVQSTIARLQHQDWYVRQAAVEVLGVESHLSEGLVRALAARLDDQHPNVQQTAIEVLQKQPQLSEDVVQSVAARLEDQDRNLRHAAIEVIRKQTDLSEEMLLSIVLRLEDQYWYVQQAAIEILGGQSQLSEEILQSVLARLKHEDWDVQRAAIEVLGKQAHVSEVILQSIATRLEHQDWYIRQAVIEVFGEQSQLSEDVLQLVAARLEDQDRDVRRTASKVLRKQPRLSEVLTQSIAARLEDQNADIRRAATDVLGKQSHLSKEMSRLVAARLQDHDRNVRQAAIEALEKRLSMDILQSIAARLEDQDWNVRQAAVEVLGRQSDLSEDILQMVAARLEDYHPSIQQAATEVLSKQLRLSEEMLQVVAARLEVRHRSVRQAAMQILVGQNYVSQRTFARHVDTFYDALLWSSFSNHMTWTFSGRTSYISNGTKQLRIEDENNELKEKIQKKQNVISCGNRGKKMPGGRPVHRQYE